MKFTVEAKDSKARAGLLRLKHGTVETPFLMPVATKAAVKALSNEDMLELDAQLMIANTYHLMLKPGADIVEKLGGLNKFMNWNRPLITDSGGFQAFSLGLGREHATGKMSVFFPDSNQSTRKPTKSTVKITDDGIHFRSIYDNSKQFLSPEKSIRLQEQLGADMILAFDECTSPLSDKKYTTNSLDRTHMWAQKCIDSHKTKQALVGIVQGGHWQDLRKKSAKYISSLPFDGLAVGGSLGKSKSDMHRILDWVVPELPDDKPRHLLGIGVVEDIFEAVERGIDLFDCVSSTMIARVGYIYVRPPLGTMANKFRYRVTTAGYKEDKTVLDPNCDCKICKNYSRAYLNHLFSANEFLAYTLASYHNIHFFMRLMKEIRVAIKEGTFSKLKKQWGL